jgi:hypothetical protein
VFRQAAQSRIITTAHRINQGSIPDLSPPSADSDFYFVQAEEPESAVARIVELVKTRIPRRFKLDPVRDIQVLCPMNRGGVGARALNLELQTAMNPAGERKIERFGWIFAPGDKVAGVSYALTEAIDGGLASLALDFPDRALPWVAERLKLTFADSQTAAIRQALACKVLVITGGPGVGKTTIVRAILRFLSAKGVKLLLCAPTGRAAKRMTEATGFEAKTIHRLLEADPQGGGFKRGDDLLVVDETSMVDVLPTQVMSTSCPRSGGRSSPTSFNPEVPARLCVHTRSAPAKVGPTDWNIRGGQPIDGVGAPGQLSACYRRPSALARDGCGSVFSPGRIFRRGCFSPANEKGAGGLAPRELGAT